MCLSYSRFAHLGGWLAASQICLNVTARCSYELCRRYLTLGSLSSNDGNGNENVTENKHLGNGGDFLIIAPSSSPLLLTEHAANGLVEAPLK